MAEAEEQLQTVSYKVHGLEQQLSSLSTQRALFSERVGDLKRMLTTLSEKNEADHRLASVFRTTQSLKSSQEELLAFNQKLQQSLKDQRKEKDILEVDLARVNVDIKLLEDMSGKSVEDQEKTSKNLKQKLQDCSLNKSRLEGQVSEGNKVG